MTDARLSVEVGAKINELQSKMTAAKASVKDFAVTTDSSLANTDKNLNISGNKWVEVNAEKAEAAATAAKAQRLASIQVSDSLNNEGNAAETASVKVGLFEKAVFRATDAQAIGARITSMFSRQIIGLGVGVLSYEIGAKAIKAAYDELVKYADQLTVTEKNTRDLQNAQLGLIDVRQKSQQDAQKELTTVDALYRATQNHNLSLVERKKAVDELQTQSPKYLKNFSDEQILTGQATGAYNSLKDSIIALAYAKAAEDEISKKAGENIKLSYDFAVKQVAINRLLKEESAIKINTSANGQAQENQQNAALGTRLNLESQINTKIKEQDDLRRQVQVNLSIISGLTKEIDKNVEANGVDTLVGNIDKKSDAAAKKLEELKNRFNEAAQAAKLFGLEAAKDLGKELSDAVENNKKAISKSLGTTTEQQDKLIANAKELGKNMKNSLVGFAPNQDDVKAIDLIIKKINDLQSAIQKGLTQSFTTFFDDILQHGTLSFKQLGKNILAEFEKIVISAEAAKLAGLLTGSINGVNTQSSKPTASGILGGIGGVLGLTGASSSGIAATVGVGTGGLLLPILGGIAAVGLIASLFKKHKTPDPVYTSNNPVSNASSGGSNQVLTVILKASGRDLVQTLNLEGYYLSRVQQQG